MKLKFRWFLTMVLLLAVLLLAAGCSQEETPYEKNDAENYTVSVKFDANGGSFTTNTSVIVDSYNLSQLPVGADGKASVALLSPDDSCRGNDAFSAVNNGYFLAGWYAERSGAAGAYSYSGKWDFAGDLLYVDPAQAYSASEPVLTLYAAWVPLFEIRFHDLATGEYMQSYTFNPDTVEEILVPALDEKTGTIEMYKFPEYSGHTFAGAYLDAEGEKPITTASVTHNGAVDFETGTARDGSMDVYIDWMEGEWFHIFNAEQFVDNASVSGNYVIHEDLDFADEIWPSSMMYGNFTGSIEGNGHTFKNITLEQTNNSKTNAGLFGHIGENVSIKDVTFENVTFTIKNGTRVAGASFGLLAGTIVDGADLSNVKILSSALQIDANAYFGTDDYVIGLVCGMGNAGIDDAGISASVTGSETPGLWAVVTDGQVTLTDVPPETTAPQIEETVPETTAAKVQ